MQCFGMMVEFATCGGNMHTISEACWFALYFLLQKQTQFPHARTPKRNASAMHCSTFKPAGIHFVHILRE